MTVKKSVKKAVKKPDDELIEVTVCRRCGVGDRTAYIGEVVEIPRVLARKYQEVGAIKVAI